MPLTALIVDDETAITAMLAEVLGQRGFQSHAVHGGLAALEWAREHRPDLMLLDLMLPDMDGYTICRQLKLDRETNRIPIVMVTGRCSPEDRVHGLEVGANEYVTKPFTFEQIDEAVTRATAWRDELQRRGTRGEVHFEMRSDTKLLEELNRLLSALLLHSGLSEREAGMLTMAVREMGANGMEWGHRKQTEMLLTVTYRIDAKKVEIVIRDKGPGFNLSNLPHAAELNDPERHMVFRDALGLRPGGFGILMTRGLVDEMSYNDKGNEVRLVKYVAPAEPGR